MDFAESQAVECEYKFGCPPEQLADIEAVMIAGLAEPDLREEHRIDTYLDTPDRRLAEARCQLRLRGRFDGEIKVCFKAPVQIVDDLLVQKESVLITTDGSPNLANPFHRRLGPFRSALAVLGQRADLTALRPIAQMRTLRRSYAVPDPLLGGEKSVFLAFDRVEARLLEPPRMVRFAEVEVETAGAYPQALALAATYRALARAEGLAPTVQTKILKALALGQAAREPAHA
ncbi:MAG: CYTH domain-containing protein [Pseudomonadota bacterium]